MREMVIEYFKMGYFNETDLALFIQAQWLTTDDYKELTGKNYQPA